MKTIIRYCLPSLIFLFFSCEKTIDTEILRFYGDAYDDSGYSVAKIQNGYLIAGQRELITRSDGKITGSKKLLSLIQTGINGEQVRIVTSVSALPGSGNKIISFPDGSSVVAGYVMDTITRQQDICVIKFAPDGEGSFEKVYKFEGNQYANDIVKTTSGYLILATTDIERGSSDDTGNANGKKDILFLSVDNNLEIIGTMPYGFTGNDEGVSLKVDPSGGYVVVGTTDRYEDETGTDIFILTVNNVASNERPSNARFIQLPGNQSAADIEVANNGYFIGGNAVINGVSVGYAWRITGSIWGTLDHHPITFEGSFRVYAVSSYLTNSFLVAGQYGSTTSGSMLIFATDLLGYPLPGKVRIAGGTGNQTAYDVIADGDDIIAVGKNSYENNSMITFLKFKF